MLKIELQIFVCLPFVSLLRVSDLPCVDESEVRQKLDRFQSTQFHTEAVFLINVSSAVKVLHFQIRLGSIFVQSL